MRIEPISAFVTVAAAVLLPLAVSAGQNPGAAHHDQRGQGQGHAYGLFDSRNEGNREGLKLKVALWGDNFYAADEATKAAMKAQTIASMNDHRLDFTIFAGDTKNGSSECTDQAIGADVIDLFNSINVPTIYSLGDNEWTDCHRANNGSMDPLERLDYLRATFFNKSTTQGPNPITVERQSDFGTIYSENSRFEMNQVEFVAVHIPGSNNNFVSSESACMKKTGRPGRAWDSVNDLPLGECADAVAEYQARNAANLTWLHDSFAKARANGDAGIVITIQADIFFPFELSDGGYAESFLPSLDNTENGYADFFYALAAETQSFDGQVLLVHGDSHFFKIDKPMYDPTSDPDALGRLTANFTRVEVFGSEDNDWIQMTVDPSSEGVFTFEPVMLPRL